MAQSPSSAADPRFAARARQPGLDMLRALAIILVLFYHAGLFGFPLPGRMQRFGWIGVDLFFVLSGYLIAGQLLKSLARGMPLNVRRFFWRRALRILPAYLFVVAIYFILPALREYPTMPPLWKFATFTQNLGLHGGTAFSHAWSLCVEAQFYLLLPFVLLALGKLGRGAIAIAGAVIVGGIILRATIAYSIAVNGAVPFRGYQPLIYYATWTRLDPLTLGVALAAIERFRAGWWATLMRNAPWLGVVGLGLIGYALYRGETEQLTITAVVWQFPLLAFGLAPLLLCAITPRLPFSRIAILGAAFTASIAYSVYLSHKLVIHALDGWCATHAIPKTSSLAIAFMMVATVSVGAALFFAIERPFLQYRQRSLAVSNK